MLFCFLRSCTGCNPDFSSGPTKRSDHPIPLYFISFVLLQGYRGNIRREHAMSGRLYGVLASCIPKSTTDAELPNRPTR